MLFKEENVPEAMDAGFHTVRMAPFLQQDELVLTEVFAFHSSEVLVTAETLATSPMKLQENLLLMLLDLLEYVTLGSAVNANAAIIAAFLMKM